MSSVLSFFESDFNTQREQWENALIAELKLTEIGSKGNKKLLDGISWPTLCLESRPTHLGVSEKWKKAATTYSSLNFQRISEFIEEDLKMGVRNFFFHSDALNQEKWEVIETVLKKFPRPEELDIFILGSHKEHYQSSFFRVVTHLVSGKLAHDYGGHSLQELALLTTNLIHELHAGFSQEIYVGVYLDSQFFHNIAKVRAAKLLIQRVNEEMGGDRNFKVVGLSSYRDWTVFERYSNMLRNESAVASGYIAGADHVQSSGYNTVLELESENDVTDEHSERSQRMARNTSHILALESMLGVVEDAAYGSFHLEGLSEALARESWALMQTFVSKTPEELKTHIEKETSIIREKRLDSVKTRRHILSGINDYPDVKEELALRLKPSNLFRVGRIFEELRFKMQERERKPSVYIALYGHYAALNTRLNFVKNYFELLGLTVHDPGSTELDKERFKKNLMARKEEIIVLCAADDQYGELTDIAALIENKQKYIAGKMEMKGFKNLHAGQNVYEILRDLVEGEENE